MDRCEGSYSIWPLIGKVCANTKIRKVYLLMFSIQNYELFFFICLLGQYNNTTIVNVSYQDIYFNIGISN